MGGVRLDVDLVALARELARDPGSIAVLVDEPVTTTMSPRKAPKREASAS